GQERQRRDERALAEQVQRVHRGVGAEARVDGVAEREHPALPEQHVVAEREDGERSHLRQQRQREAAGESPWCHYEQHGRRHPDGKFHPSRVPISPFERTISISTMTRYGSTGATCEIL